MLATGSGSVCRRGWILLALSAVLVASERGSGDEGNSPPPDVRADARGPVLDARQAEHLWNRFAFGASTAELERCTGMRAGEVFDEWVACSRVLEPRGLLLLHWDEYGCDRNGNELDAPGLASLELEELIAHRQGVRTIDKSQFRDHLDDWIADAVEGNDPLRDRMTLFWHGYFPTSVRVTLRRYELVRQHEMLRRHALGSFRDLLHAIVRDAAILSFFDNDSSRVGHPNENFARELLELYSLGQGNFTEQDVREAARALTGYQGVSGEFHFDATVHDRGEKTIFGRTGRFDGDDLAGLLLDHPACARHVAGKLLAWMEGVEPDPERLELYARLLESLEFELVPWLRALATDPDFYRPAIVGTRIMGPVELLVSGARRLEYPLAPGFVFFAGEYLGQLLYGPPSVKGWNEGEDWVTSERLLRRNHCLGLMVGGLQLELAAGHQQVPPGFLQRVIGATHANPLAPQDLAGPVRAALVNAADDSEIADHLLEAWLAREPDAATRLTVQRQLARLRDCTELAEGPLLEQAGCEEVLRRLAHVLLSLPIAQLH